MKDTIYFTHDCNARNDRKIVSLRMKYGVEGVGIFWCLVEMLYEEGGFLMLSECDRIAFELQSQCDKILSVIRDFELFENDEKSFWSNSAIERIKIRDSKSDKARKSALKRWDNANAMRSQCEGNAKKENKSKVKEKKRKEKEHYVRQKNLNSNLKKDAIEIIEFLNEKTGKNYQPKGVNLEIIIARFKEGATTTNCRQIIAKKRREWIGDEKMSQFLRPKTLFNKTNFANYLGELVQQETDEKEIRNV